MNAYKEFWTKMFKWDATATRRQYWIPIIINFIIALIIELLLGAPARAFTASNPFEVFATDTSIWVISLIFWIANFTIRARRLHDTGRSNWWILIEVIPLIGGIWFLVLMLLPSKLNEQWPDNQSDIE